MFWPLWVGATIVVPDPEKISAPGWLADWLRDEGVTVTHLTPAMGQLVTEPLSRAGGAPEIDNLRLALFIGDVLTRHDVKRLRTLAPRATVVNLYGTTETQRASGHHVVAPDDELEHGDNRRREVLPLGAGIPGTQLLVRTESDVPAAVGEIGEVVFRSHHLALGYLGQPDETAARFVAPSGDDGRDATLYRTGDRGRYRANGEVEFLGRRDGQVQLRGFRIELGEIRAALIAHPDVNDAVIDLRGDNGTSQLVAYVVPAPGATPKPDDLRSFLRGELPGHMVPADFVPLTRVPLTPNGKLDRASLPAPDRDHGVDPGSEPRDAVEAQLVARWQEVLGRPNVGIHDNFFDVGGYSLLATRLFGLIEQDTGQRLPVSTLFEAPTIAELAGVVRAGEVPAEWASLVPIQPRGSQRPFFYVAPYMISVLQLAHLGVELGDDQPLYGLQPQGLDGNRPIHTRVEEMAEAYIREIKTVQPRGPYRIGGHCAGSWVAFEMARQLEATGDELDAVVLVDQGPPGFPQTIRWPSYLMFRIRFYFRDGRLRHATAWQLKIALDRLRIRRRWNPALEHAQRVRAAHRAAYRDYQGGPVDTDLVLVRSEESLALADKNWHTRWKSFTRGRFHEKYALGTHANLLEEPYVVVLADRIRWAFTRPR
jgi:thioesterase domain-containing protein